MCFKNEQITILYGSQTGNAQDVAERIWRESKRFYFVGSVMPLDEYPVLKLVNEAVVLFVCSTTGQGDEPDNMRNFWRFLLRRDLPRDSLKNLRFAVLGLGDSSYFKFNFAAKRLNKRLIQLGAQALIPLGLGDDQHDMGYDAVVDPWINSLWMHLLQVYPLANGLAPREHIRIEPKWNVSNCSSGTLANLPSSIYNSDRHEGEFEVTVKSMVKTTASTHFQDVRLIALESNGEKYLPGDTISIRPRNSQKQVDEFIAILKENGAKIDEDCLLKISEISSEMPVPPPLRLEVSFRQLCEEYFDLSAVPRRHIFTVLGQITDSDLEKEKCEEFTTSEGLNDLYNYCNRPHRNIVEVLQDFPHATKNITYEILFEIMSPIKAREFSIASSWKAHKDEIHMLVAVVKYKTKLVKERLGLCSNFLANMRVGDKLSVWLKKGSFNFPELVNSPVILVGPGTGLAPFRSFINECLENGCATASNLILFFGCRGFNDDFHCKEELLTLNETGKLNLICAFSRDQDHKVYVQHRIKEQGALVWDALKNPKSIIFVAGSSKNMPREVREAFVKVCACYGDMSEEKADEFILDMEKRGRYQIESWS